jgi:hypothetical protein
MRHLNLVALLLPLTLIPSYPAAAQAPDNRSDLGANAAMKYWQAFALLPTPDQDQAKLLQNWKDVPIYEGSAALKLIDASRMSRVYLHRGAKLQRCNWSLDDEDGPGLFMSHCPRSLNLARLALLHARYEFEQGHWQEVWEDVTDVLKLGRHVGIDPPLVVRWVGYRIETSAIEAAAPYLPELKPILPEAASAVLDALPAGPTLQQMVLEEKRTGLMWEIQELRKAEQHKKGSWRGVWRNLVDPPWLESRDRDLVLVQSVQTFEQAIKRLEDLVPFYDEMARVIALPWKEFDAQYPELVKKAKVRDLRGFDRLNKPDGIIAGIRHYETQMALFKAALTVVKGGPDQLKAIKDPFGDGPFEFRALDKGFELKSKLVFKGQPVMLSVGQGKRD